MINIQARALRDRGWLTLGPIVPAALAVFIATTIVLAGSAGAIAWFAVLERRYPDARLVDTMTPPFRELTSAEEQDVVDRINAAAPDVVWVGLSTLKGPRFVAKSLAELFRESLQDRAL